MQVNGTRHLSGLQQGALPESKAGAGRLLRVLGRGVRGQPVPRHRHHRVRALRARRPRAGAAALRRMRPCLSPGLHANAVDQPSRAMVLPALQAGCHREAPSDRQRRGGFARPRAIQSTVGQHAAGTSPCHGELARRSGGRFGFMAIAACRGAARRAAPRRACGQHWFHKAERQPRHNEESRRYEVQDM